MRRQSLVNRRLQPRQRPLNQRLPRPLQSLHLPRRRQNQRPLRRQQNQRLLRRQLRHLRSQHLLRRPHQPRSDRLLTSNTNGPLKSGPFLF